MKGNMQRFKEQTKVSRSLRETVPGHHRCLADPRDGQRALGQLRRRQGGREGAKGCSPCALGHLQVTPQTQQAGNCQKFSQLNPYGGIPDFFFGFFSGPCTCQSKCLWSVLSSLHPENSNPLPCIPRERGHCLCLALKPALFRGQMTVD